MNQQNVERRRDAFAAHPAILGGAPLFQPDPIGTAQLFKPDLAALQLRLEAILASGQRSDHGIQCRELEHRLAEYHRIDHVVCMANASYGILFALALAAGERAGAIAMPSYSYRGLPFFATILGRQPCFVDIEPSRGTLDPEALAAALRRGGIAAVLAVHNADAPAHTDALAQVCAEAGVPLVFDSVFAFGSAQDGDPFGRGGLAEVFSLHATKMLNGFEGGYVTTQSAALAQALRALRDRGGEGAGGLPPFPCPLPELHAATALVCLDELPALISRNRRRWQAYREGLETVPGLRLWTPPPGLSPSGCSALLELSPEAALTRDELLRVLGAEGILARTYYGPALHQVRPWSLNPNREPLPVTEALAPRVLQLPVGERLELDDIAVICAFIGDLMGRGHAPLASVLPPRSKP